MARDSRWWHEEMRHLLRTRSRLIDFSVATKSPQWPPMDRACMCMCVCVDQATFLASQSLGSASGELFQLIYVCVYVCIYLAICRRFDLVHHNAPQRHLLTAWRQFNCCFYVYLIFLAKNSLKLWQLLAIKTVFVYTLYP